MFISNSYKKNFLFFGFIFLFFQLSAQLTVYSEDFSTDGGAGYNSGYTAPTSSSWTMTLVGSPDVSGGGDYCAVFNDRLEWKDMASASMANRVDWYSPSVSGAYTNVAISIDWYTYGTYCGGIEATLDIYYRLDGGSWVQMANPSSNGATSGTASASSLTSTTSIELLVQGSTANCSNALAYIDNISITADCPASYSGTYDVGPTGTWATLTSAITALNSCMTDDVVLELESTYSEASETYPLDFSGLPTTSTETLIIRPKTATSVTFDDAQTTTLLDFNTTDYVTIDGRPGGAGATSYFTFENTSTATGGNVIEFTNDATNNTIQYCTLKSNYASTSEGVVVFGTTSVTSGNDDNTITYCTIDGSAGATASPTSSIARSGIYSSGTAAKLNSGNMISYNEFKDVFMANSTSDFIYLDAYNTAWTISNNSFYQTNTRTASGTATITCINIDDGEGYTINNNYIGGSAASNSGTWTQGYSGSNRSHFYGMDLALNTGATDSTEIQGNTINGFSMTHYSSTYFVGVYIAEGLVNIGTSTANVVGSYTTTGGITINKAGTSTASIINAFRLESTQNVLLQGNDIGSFTISFASTYSCTFDAISILSSTFAGGSIDITSNRIGGSIANSIQVGNGSTSGSIFTAINDNSTRVSNITSNEIGNITITGGYFVGIELGYAAGAYAKTVSNNTIGVNPISNSAASTSQQAGILLSNTGSNYTISSNTINDITLSGAANLNLSGILCTSSGTYTIVSNDINSLSITNTGSYYGYLSGIRSNSTSAFDTQITKNTIYSLSNTQTHANASIYGVYYPGNSTGSGTLVNNYISLGEDGANVGVFGVGVGTTGAPTLFMYYNTVEVKGTPTSGTHNSSAFYYNKTASTHVDALFNNIFYNSRTNGGGATGSHYCFYTNIASNITAGVVDYNFYYAATDASFAYVAGDRDAATFNSASQGYGGTNSVYSQTITINSDGSLSSGDITVVGTGMDLSNSGSYPNCQDDLYGTVGDRATGGGTIGMFESGVAPLPISLLYFKAELKGRDVLLSWKTASEKNNDYFTIEKTLDGQNFKVIGLIQGAGNSTSPRQYTLYDFNIQKVINYYRLIQTDYDGNSTYSKLVSIDNRSEEINKQIVGIYNILGQEIKQDYKGLVILVYSDGSSRKMFQE